MILVLDKPLEKDKLSSLLEDYPEYIKVVVDVQKMVLAAGGKYHIDGEEVLIRQGSKQEDLYGGGCNLITGETEYMAMSNYKPQFGHVTYEISDKKIREVFKKVVNKVFGDLKYE